MVVEVANGYLIALSGRLDVSAVSEVRTVLHGAIDAGSGDLVVDLSAVEVVDATGLGFCSGADRRAKQRDRRLVFRRRLAPGAADPAGHPPAPGAHARVGRRPRLSPTPAALAGSYRPVGCRSCGTSPG